MIKITPISQRDPEHSRKRLGFGTGTIGQYGCVLTSVVMVLRYFGVNITVSELNEKLKTVDGWTGDTKNLLVWTAVERLYPGVIKWRGSFGYNDANVKKLLSEGTPVIIVADAAPIGAPRTTHFFVALGDKMIADPWVGDVRPISDFPDLIGYRVFEKIGEPVKEEDGMPNMYKGLDLSNPESMKVAVDVWADMRDGKFLYKDKVEKDYVPKDQLEKMKRDHEQDLKKIYLDHSSELERAVGRTKVLVDAIKERSGVEVESKEDVFKAFDKFYSSKKSQENPKSPLPESLKLQLRLAVFAVVGGAVTYLFSHIPVLGVIYGSPDMIAESTTTLLVSLILAGVDKLIHESKSTKLNGLLPF